MIWHKDRELKSMEETASMEGISGQKMRL